MLTYAMFSKIGKRKQNEDAVRMYEKNNEVIFVLADGLGGHGYGDEASRVVTKQAVETFLGERKSAFCIATAFDNAQKSLLSKKKYFNEKQHMKTTMVILQVNENEISWGHIGDSRLYYFKEGKIEERTLDHSVPQMLALSGKIKEQQIRNHPDRNRVLRVLGTPWEGSSYEIGKPKKICGDQVFLLCSDGFWELIDELDMERLLKKSVSPAQWLGLMEQVILENGANINMDNYSAIAVWI